MQAAFPAYFDAFARHPTLVELLLARAAEQPERSIYAFAPDDGTPERRLTYAELDQRARAIGAQLQALGAAGQRVLLFCPPGLDMIAGLFGCLYAHAVAVPVPPPGSVRTLERVESVAQAAQVTAVLGPRLLSAVARRRMRPGSHLQHLAWVSSDDRQPGQAERWTRPAIAPTATAYLQYTSGSTGAPKGVVISYQNLLHNAALIASAWQMTRERGHVLWMPTFHDFGLVAGVVQSIYSDAPLLLLSPLSVMQHPIRWLQAIARSGAAISGGMNFGFELCVRQTSAADRAALDLRGWQVSYSGGEMVHQETLDRFSRLFAPAGFQAAAFAPAYGLAEATLLVTSARPGHAPVAQLDKQQLEQGLVAAAGPGTPARSLVSCGAPLGDMCVRVVDPAHGQICPPDRIGEIWVAGPSVAAGYWDTPEAAAQTFGATLPGQDGWFLRTGDLGFLRDGQLYISGRIKDLIIIRGRNLYPHDIEQAVARCHPALRPGYAAAFAVEAQAAEQLVIVHELRRGSDDHDAVVRAIRQAVAEEFEVRPAAVTLVEEGSIPQTSSGKIARQSCRAAFLSGALKPVYRWLDQQDTGFSAPPAPRGYSAIAGWLSARIAGGLGVDPATIDPRRALNSYGLDSIDTVTIIRELESWLGIPLTPAIAWDYPSIELLARHLAGEAAAGAGQSEPDGPAVPAGAGEPIAIVGIGCRFPGAATPEQFWELLRRGEQIARDVPARAWDTDSFFDPRPATPGRMYTRRGAFLEQVDQFDPFFFGISPREAGAMDPQQRLVLEVAWEALEHAGQSPEALAGSRTGVFIGISTNDYYQRQLRTAQPAHIDMYAGIGNALTFAANRVSYLLDLRGPSLAIDTACSSSLVAIHMACQSLLAGETSMALAGGVNVILAPELNIIFCNQRVLARDGRCKTFDAGADGHARGEGCGIVVLKRLRDALADGSRVLGLIRGSAVNQDGRSNGITAPNGLAQQAVIREALARARCQPADLGYIEAHGTGTELGDPIEVAALRAVLAQDPVERPCFVGSVKANIAHLEAAAGVAGLIKAALVLLHGEVVPQPNFSQLNPYITLQDSRLRIPTAAQPLPSGGRLVAGVSAFAFGGTNAHVVLEAAPAPEPAPTARPAQLLLLSAKTGSALAALTDNLRDYLQQQPAIDMADLAFTLQVGRAGFDYRRMLVCHGRLDAVAGLSGLDGRLLTHMNPPRAPAPAVVLVLPGLPAASAPWAASLYRHDPLFRAQVEECMRELEPLIGAERSAGLLTSPGPATQHAGLALFVAEYALARLLLAYGVRPRAMVAAGVGEYVAACLAGALPLSAALARLAGVALPARLAPGPVHLPYISSLTGQWVTPEQLTDPGYYAALPHAAALEPALDRLLGETPGDLLVTVGTDQLRGQRVGQAQAADGAPAPIVAAGAAGEGYAQLLHALGQLWLRGLALDWRAGWAGEHRQRITLPSYPFERQRCWFEPAPAGPAEPAPPAADAARPPAGWFSTPVWRRSPTRPQTADLPPGQSWLICSDTYGVGAALAVRLRQSEQRVIQVAAGADFRRIDETTYQIDPAQPSHYASLLALLAGAGGLPEQIVHLWGLLPAAAPAAEQLGHSYTSLIALAQALAQQPASRAAITVVANGVQSVSGDEPLVPEKAAVIGPCRVIPQEYPQLSCRLIDVVAPAASHDASALAGRLYGEIAGGAAGMVAQRGLYRWEQLFEPVAPAAAGATGSRLRPGGVYLITGGLGGIGLELARSFASTAPVRLALLGRTALPLPPEDQTNGQIRSAPHGQLDAKVRAVQALQAMGAQVLTVAADVADQGQLSAAIGQIQQRFGPINGVVHAAGVADVRTIAQTTPEQATLALRAKLQGARALEAALAHQQLDFMVLFSSAAALTGGVGLASYCAANATLDTFASYYTATYGGFALAINWDLWRDVGMITRGAQPALDEYALRYGLLPQEGCAAFAQLLASDGLPPQVVVAKRAVWAGPQQSGRAPARPAARARPRPDMTTPYVAPTGQVEQSLAAIWQELLGVAQVGIDDNFFDLGGDSLLGAQTASRLKQDLAVTIATVDIYEHPTVRLLSRLIEPPPAPAAEPPAAEQSRYQGNASQRKQFLERRRARNRQHDGDET